MLDPDLLERITARRAELDELEEQLVNSRRRPRQSGTNSPSPSVPLSG
jgi:hypothetical protein